MPIHRATLQDLDALARLEQYFPSDRLNRAHLRHLLRRGHADIWACKNEGLLLGDAVVLYRRGAQTARLYSLVVHPDHRRCGVARSLLTAAESTAGVRGCRALRLEVRPDNASAIRLYRKCGYKITGKREGYYEDGVDALTLTKGLATASAETSERSRPRRRPPPAAPCPIP